MNLSACPRVALPASTLIQSCKASWGDIARLVVKHPDGVNPFEDTTIELQQTNIITQTDWDTAIALSTVDSLFLSPEAKNFELVAGEAENFTYPDGDIEIVKVGASTATMTFYGLTAENEEALTLLSGGGVDLMFINKAGQTIGRKIEEITGSPFFRCTSILGAARSVNTGTEPDRNVVTITFEPDALLKWEKYATEAFAKTI